MINSKFFYPEVIQKQSIDIPKSVHNYLKKTPLSFQGKKKLTYIHIPLPRKEKRKSLVAITYGGVEGQNPTEVPEKYTSDKKLKAVTREYPFQNINEEDQIEADKVAIAAIRKIRGPGRYSIRKKEYMINTNTIPIRISFAKDGIKQRNPIYVKKPNLSRLMGRWLYDIASGAPRKSYMFNRAVFIEDNVPGHILSELDESELIKNPLYREGLIRASAHASFLEVPDIVNERNRIVSSNFSTLLFDFDVMFLGRFKSAGVSINNLLLNYYQTQQGNQYRDLMTPRVDDILIDEYQKMGRRVKANEDRFFGMVKAMEDVEHREFPGMSYRQVAKDKYGSDSLETLFRKKLAFW